MRSSEKAVIVAIAALVCLGAWRGVEDYAHRAQIKRDCTLIRREAGSSFTAVGSKGGISFGETAPRACYKCPSGVEECI